MKRTRMILLFAGLLLAFGLFSSAYAADVWRCSCCDDPTCPNLQGKCWAGKGTTSDWTLYKIGESADATVNENGTVTYTEDGLLVDGKKKHHSWTYYYTLDKSYRHYLNWRASLDVLELRGAVYAGVVMGNENIQLSFRVNRFGSAELALVHSNRSAPVVERFFLPKELRGNVGGAFTMDLAYDIPSGRMTAYLDGIAVKDVTLPYNGIPAITSIYRVCIESLNKPRSAEGSILCGDLRIKGENP